MTISRTFQWYSHATVDPTSSPSAISGATSSSYTSLTADVGKYLHMKETAANSKGSTTATSNVVGPVAAAGTTYSPAAGTIAPITAAVGGRALSPRIIKRTEQAIYDAEIISMNALHDLMHAATPQTVAVSSGLWSSPTTWSNGVPVAGMTVHIPSAFEVLYDVESNAQLQYIMVHGRLRWDVTKDTKLVCDTIHTGAASYFEIGTPTAPIAESATAGKPRASVVFIGGAPGSSTRLGLMTMGKVSIHGARKPDKVDLQAGPAAGATTITVKTGTDITAWKVGDALCVLSRDYTGFGADPQYTGPTQYAERYPNANTNYSNDPTGFKQSHDEVRTITAINGQVVTLSSALQYAHPARTTTRTLPQNPVTTVPNFTGGQTVTIPASVTNLSRSIRFESGGLPLSDLQKRAHIMLMACDQVNVRYAEAKNMGRTDVNPTLFISEPKYNPTYPDLFQHTQIFTDNTLATDLANPNNVRGRYPWHLHGNGVFGDGPRFSRNMCVFEGLTAWAPQTEVPQPGWAITHHNSRLAVHNCVVYNVRGAGIVSEVGSEIGQWNNNTVSWCRGDGWAPFWAGRQREQPNHNGHAGVAYENQSRSILMHNNEFTSCRTGFLYSVQTQLTTNGYGTARAQDHQSLRHFNPINGSNGGYDKPDRDTYGKAAAQIPDMNFCTGVDFDQFFRVDHRVEIYRGDPTAMIAVGWRCYGGNVIQNFDNYTYKYFFRDFAYWGGNGGGVALLGTRTSIFGWKNGIVEGFGSLIQSGSQGNYGPGWIDIATNLTVTNDANGSTSIKNSATFPVTAPSFAISTGWSQYKINITPGFQSIGFTGIITDGYSPTGRHWPEFHEPDYTTGAATPEPTDANPIPAALYVNEMTGWSLVERNGVFQSSGNWYMPAYYSTVDWATFKHFVIRVDHPLTGAWDSTFLTANTVTPTPPTYPLPPEDINKPFPSISAPTNTTLPFIYGAPLNGLVIECDPGVWSAKPNDVDWYAFQWKRAGVAITGEAGRSYTLTATDIGQAITVDVTAYNSGGKTTVTSASVTARAAPTAPTPLVTLGAGLVDYFSADDPDTSGDIYQVYMKSPGLAMNSHRNLLAWGGNRTLPPNITRLETGDRPPNVQPYGWLIDKSQAVNFEPWRGSIAGRVWALFGSGTEPAHLWVVVQRSSGDQAGGGAMVSAFGHDTSLQNTSLDVSQNKIVNNAGGSTRTITTGFGKGAAGVLYHARNSQGALSGFNNVITSVNTGLSAFDRYANFGFNGAHFMVKAIYWSNQDIITTQQYANTQVWLGQRYLGL